MQSAKGYVISAREMPARGTMLHNKIAAVLKLGAVVIGIATLCAPIHAVERRHGVLVGTIVDVSSAAKTVVVKAADGTEHTLRFAEHTVVHGAKDVARGTVDAFHGMEKGTKVAVHYTAEGAKETADEVDKIGDDGMKAVKVTVTHVDHTAKTVGVTTADGAKETYRTTERAADEIGKDVAKGSEKTAKGTAYVTDEAGHKVVHFFARAF
jgi:hypothetical protein